MRHVDLEVVACEENVSALALKCCVGLKRFEKILKKFTKRFEFLAVFLIKLFLVCSLTTFKFASFCGGLATIVGNM